MQKLLMTIFLKGFYFMLQILLLAIEINHDKLIFEDIYRKLVYQ